MEANKILQSDLLDIIFEGRNKSYGAYELRHSYNRRIKVAVITMACICLVFITGVLLANSGGKKMNEPVFATEVKLTSVQDPEKEKPLPEPVKPEPVEVHTIADTPPIILPDPQVPETEVPNVDDLENVQISTQNREGEDIERVAPPIEVSTGQAELPVKQKEEEPTFITIQSEAKFPGGADAWRIYLERNLNTNMPVDNGAAAGNYTVIVSFVVDKDGNISDVQALNDPGYGTAQEAIRVIKKSKQWTPALQNGRNVTYRQKQSITFVVSEG